MALAQRITALHKRHQWLDQILAQEMNHASPDEARMSQIKKSKLRVKDEIVALESIRQKLDYATDEAAGHYRKTATRH